MFYNFWPTMVLKGMKKTWTEIKNETNQLGYVGLHGDSGRIIVIDR